MITSVVFNQEFLPNAITYSSGSKLISEHKLNAFDAIIEPPECQLVDKYILSPIPSDSSLIQIVEGSGTSQPTQVIVGKDVDPDADSSVQSDNLTAPGEYVVQARLVDLYTGIDSGFF